MGKKAERKAALKKGRKQKQRRFLIVSAAAVAALMILGAVWLLLRPPVLLSSRSSQAAALKDYIFADATLGERLDIDGPYVVFLSVCDAKDRARVVNGRGDTLRSAWDAADKKAWGLVKNVKRDAVWVKADIVDSAEEIPVMDLQKEIVNAHYRFFYRRGVAFDPDYQTAFLEAEMNGNRIYRYYHEDEIRDGQVDYTTPGFNMTNLNNYLTQTGHKPMKEIPGRITTFTTLGFFCGEDCLVRELYANDQDYGRRVIDMVDDKAVEEIILDASRFLIGQIGPDGKYLYGHYPIFDNPMEGYNTIRHICATWSLLNNYYRLTRDESLLPPIKASINYMLDHFIEYPEDGVAWVIERTADEVRLGGNAVAVVMLTEYMDLRGTDEYLDLVRLLANGVVRLQDPNNGSFYHVLNYPDYSPKEEYRIIYYDGEATFALARAYAATGDGKYLDAAVASVENFIRNDYTIYVDHWVAYSMNEVTKYVDDPRYYEFALRNVSDNLNRIYGRVTSFHTYMELLMVSWETYERIISHSIPVAFPDNFDLESFAQTIYKRARHMLNGYFYPEYAMYMRYPGKILDSFFVRHQDFRVRIDDVQHFLGGYFKYLEHYDEILPYLSDDFLESINSFDGKGGYALAYDEEDDFDE